MLVLSVNEVLGWVQITTGRGTYTCPTTTINEELYFHFKGEWHRVEDYLYIK